MSKIISTLDNTFSTQFSTLVKTFSTLFPHDFPHVSTLFPHHVHTIFHIGQEFFHTISTRFSTCVNTFSTPCPHDFPHWSTLFPQQGQDIIHIGQHFFHTMSTKFSRDFPHVPHKFFTGCPHVVVLKTIPARLPGRPATMLQLPCVPPGLIETGIKGAVWMNDRMTCVANKNSLVIFLFLQG